MLTTRVILHTSFRTVLTQAYSLNPAVKTIEHRPHIISCESAILKGLLITRELDVHIEEC